MFVHNDDATRVSVQVVYKGRWQESPECEDTEAACFALISMVGGLDA